LLDDIFVRCVVGIADDDLSRALVLVLALCGMLWTPGNLPLSIPGPGNETIVGPANTLFKWRSAPVARLLAQAVDRRSRRQCGRAHRHHRCAAAVGP
jgi:hypothetical protein